MTLPEPAGFRAAPIASVQSAKEYTVDTVGVRSRPMRPISRSADRNADAGAPVEDSIRKLRAWICRRATFWAVPWVRPM